MTTGPVPPKESESKVVSAEFVSYGHSITEALDAVGAREYFARVESVLIKPNLVEAIPPPVTTPVECVEAIIVYIRSCSGAKVTVGEGCGAANHETQVAFDALGYTNMARRLGVPLVDLNHAPTVLLRNPACRVFPEFHMPAIAMDHCIVSVPVLKAHSLAKITGTLKNMMGFASPKYYQAGGHWKKSVFHRKMHESIVDLNRYRKPDITVMDATVGLAEYHLGGRECKPRVNKILAGYDPLELDRAAAGFLGFDWRKIPHLASVI